MSTFIIIVFFLSAGKIKAQESLEVIRGESNNNSWLQYSDVQNSLYHHLANQAYELLDQRAEEIAGLNTLSDWQERQKSLRETFSDIVGPFPEKTPLNAKILRTVTKDEYKVEHIVYESQPGFYVTSSLFIPERLRSSDKAPAVIYASGHSNLGYRGEVYQHVILNLVKKGFIVFAFDPVGQGERLEYIDPDTGNSLISGANEHSYAGAQAFITGNSQAMHMIWDGIRAVDYLLTRNEVDPSRIGITGRSGGGTQSSYIAAIDDRIYAVAPECYLTNFTRLLQTIGPQDAEQNMFNAISRGVDHGDFLLVRAPKPALIIATTRDIFSIHGFRETETEVSHIYKAYGKEDNLSSVEDDAPHTSTKKNREAMYTFFQKHLNNPGNPNDEETQPLTEDEIQVTQTGQVSTSLGGETIYSLNSQRADKLVRELEASRNNLERHIPGVLNSSKKLSGYREPSEINVPVFTGRIQREGYVIEKYFTKGEGDHVIPYLLMIPDKPNNKALVYLHPTGKNIEASEGGEIEWFIKNGFTVLAPDVLGVGETGPESINFNHPYIQKWYASTLIGRSIVGIRAADVIQLVRLLKKDDEISDVYGVARKQMTPVLLHAAAFDPGISRIALIEPYSSYRSIVMNRFYDLSFIYSTVPGALEAYDLPDLASTLAPRKLVMAGVTDGAGNSVEKVSLDEDFSVIRAAYQYREAKGQFTYTSTADRAELFDLFDEWIK